MNTLYVDMAELRSSATRVQAQGDEFAVAQAAVDTRVAAAGGGWTGSSANALGALLAKMKSETAIFVNRVDAQAQHVNGAVEVYAAHEERRAQAMESAVREEHSAGDDITRSRR